MTGDWRPRLSIEITKEQYNALQRLIPWGMKGQLFSALVDSMIKLLEDKGEIVIAAIITKKLKVENLLNMEDPDESK